MIRLALGSLRQHRGGYIGTFLAATLAIGLLAAGGLSLFAVLTARPPADRLAAADAVISGERAVTLTTSTPKKDKLKTKTKTERLTGAGTLPVDLAARVGAVAGVAAAVPDAAFPLTLTVHNVPVRAADGAAVIGHGWASARLTPYLLRAGGAPGPGEVVLDADLAERAGVSPGATVVVTTRTGTRPARVSGIAAPSHGSGLPAQGALFVADSDLTAVSGLAGPTAVAVLAAPGVDLSALTGRLAAVAADAPVLTGADKVAGDLPGALPDYIAPISIFGFVIGITGFAAIFVLTSTVAFGVRQRLRELALLRTAGATPSQVRRMLGVESVLVALLAAVPGLPAGVLLAQVIAARFRDLGVVPVQFTVRVNVLVLVAAALAGVLVTFAAARVAGRRAARIAPTQALTETATAPVGRIVGRIGLALLCAGGATAVLVFVPMGGSLGLGMGFVSCALLLCAVAALGPVVVAPIVAVASRLVGLAGVAGWLAGTVARTQSRRIASVAVPLALMFALNATVLLNSELSSQLIAGEQGLRTAPAMVDISAAAGLPLSTVEQVVATPGIVGAAAVLPTRAIVSEAGKPEDYPAVGLLTTGAEKAVDLGVRPGALAGEGTHDGTFAASVALAEARGWRVGDPVTVWLADGYRVELRLAAVYERSRGFGDLVLPAGLVAAHDPVGLATRILSRVAGSDVTARLTTAWPDLTVVSRLDAGDSVNPPTDGPDQQGAWELMVVISFGFTAIAVVNTFAIATSARRREYAGLRLAGATAGQIWRMASRESLIAVGAGLVIGVTVTAIVVGVFSTAQDGRFRLIVDGGLYVGMLAAVTALGLVAGALPVRTVVRRRSLPAIADSN